VPVLCHIGSRLTNTNGTTENVHAADSRIVSDAIADGISLLDEIGQASAPNLAADVIALKSRLDAMEARLAQSLPG
jgi:hypothetical protein